MKTTLLIATCVLVGLLVLAFANTPAQSGDMVPERKNVKGPKKEYSPYADDHFPNRVFFGDTHLHSSWSTDAGMAGASGQDPTTAYRVSRGETVTSHQGWKVKLNPPARLPRTLRSCREPRAWRTYMRRSDPDPACQQGGEALA